MKNWYWVVNLHTGETGRVRALDASRACEAVGWDLEYCDVRPAPRRFILGEAAL